MVRKLPDYELIQGAEAEPILLMGSPEKLTGEVTLTNSGDQRVVVRGAHIRDIPEPVMRAQAVRVPEVHANVIAILLPGQQHRARVQVRMASSTPPGEYKVRLALGDYSYPAILHVTENVELEVTPNPIVIENRPGSRAEKQVVIRNTGNVSLKIGSPGPVPLDDELLRCRSVRAALAEGYESAETWEQWLTTLLRQGKRALDKAGMLWVDNAEGEVTVEPGGVRTIRYQIRQPDTNDSTARYTGLAFLYTTDLIFAVVPSGYIPPPKRPHNDQTPTPEEGSQQESPARKRPRSSE